MHRMKHVFRRSDKKSFSDPSKGEISLHNGQRKHTNKVQAWVRQESKRILRKSEGKRSVIKICACKKSMSSLHALRHSGIK